MEAPVKSRQGPGVTRTFETTESLGGHRAFKRNTAKLMPMRAMRLGTLTTQPW